MKKVISVVMCVVMLLCCVCFAGCSSQSSEQTDGKVIKAEDIQKALVNAGFTEAYIPKDLSSTRYEEIKYVYIDKSETGYVRSTNLGGDFLPELCFKKSRDDIPEILDAVMPLYDKNFEQGDGEKIVKNLKSDRFFSDDYTRGGQIYFKDYEYSEFLDDTKSFTRDILVQYIK